MKPSLIVHGGAWDIPEEAFEACKEGCGRGGMRATNPQPDPAGARGARTRAAYDAGRRRRGAVRGRAWHRAVRSEGADYGGGVGGVAALPERQTRSEISPRARTGHRRSGCDGPRGAADCGDFDGGNVLQTARA